MNYNDEVYKCVGMHVCFLSYMITKTHIIATIHAYTCSTLWASPRDSYIYNSKTIV